MPAEEEGKEDEEGGAPPRALIARGSESGTTSPLMIRTDGWNGVGRGDGRERDGGCCECKESRLRAIRVRLAPRHHGCYRHSARHGYD